MRGPQQLVVWTLAVWVGLSGATSLPETAGVSETRTHVVVPGVERWQLGECEVFALSDQRFELEASRFAALPEKDWPRVMAKSFRTQAGLQSVTAYAVRKGKAVALINAGRGARQGGKLGWVTDNLKSVGISPDEVTAIFLTSMHADQVTGLVDEAEQRVFKNAQVYATPQAMQHWLADYSYVQAPDAQKVQFAATITSVMPYVKVGRLQPLDDGLALWPDIKAVVLSGRAAGRIGLLIEAGEQRLLVTGDPLASQAEQRRTQSMAARKNWRLADAYAPFPGEVKKK